MPTALRTSLGTIFTPSMKVVGSTQTLQSAPFKAASEGEAFYRQIQALQPSKRCPARH